MCADIYTTTYALHMHLNYHNLSSAVRVLIPTTMIWAYWSTWFVMLYCCFLFSGQVWCDFEMYTATDLKQDTLAQNLDASGGEYLENQLQLLTPSPPFSMMGRQEVIIAMPPKEAEDFRSSLLTGGVSEVPGRRPLQAQSAIISYGMLWAYGSIMIMTYHTHPYNIQIHVHTLSHTHTCLYSYLYLCLFLIIYIYVCVCVCVCVWTIATDVKLLLAFLLVFTIICRG